MRLFGSIEDRHGVDEPDYELPVDEPVAIPEEDKRVGPLEIIGSLVIPPAGVVFAIMRFASNEVGPGFACLLTGIVGWFCWTIVLVSLA
jgi:hypothetical protein